MRLNELAIGNGEIVGDSAISVTSATHRSDEVVPGSLFCCIAGQNADGHDFAEQAIEAGATALLVERRLNVSVPQICVPSVRQAIGPIASAIYGNPSAALTVVGVTGTNGKTTTTYLVEAIARSAGYATGVIGTTGVRIGDSQETVERTTPEAPELHALLARMRDKGVQVVAMEVSSHALDQHRLDGTRFAVACFTNLSHDHLDYHHSLEEYFEAKAKLFQPEFTSQVVINIEGTFGQELVQRAQASGLKVQTVSAESTSADVFAENIDLTNTGSSFDLHINNQTHRVQSPLVGQFNVSNILGAAAAAVAIGIPLDAVIAGLSTPIVVPGRMERINSGQGFTVLVDYAHSPDSLERVLETVRGLTSGKVLVVFGCGGDRDREKRPIMGRIAGKLADEVFITSDNPRNEDPAKIVQEIVAGLTGVTAQYTVELDRERAIGLAMQQAAPGDTVVIAGKGHEPGQTAMGVTKPFDDREVARKQLQQVGSR